MRELILFCCLLFAGFSAEAVIVYGNPVAVGQGTVQSYVQMDSGGQAQSLGVVLSEGALEGLPENDVSQYTLQLPSVVNLPPYNHIMVEWNPHGHEPDPIYGLPHFDFHFYFISEETRKAISCQGDDVAACMTQPLPEKLPSFYVPTPAGVPEMGWHWVDSRSPEFNGQTFTATYLYGYYGGNMIFLEPMITRDFLLKQQCFEADVPLPQVVPAAGYYPQSYAMSFNKNLKMYFIRLRNLVYRN